MPRRVQWYADSGHLVSDNVPLSAIPLDADWGSGTLKNTLCLDGQPLVVNFVGTVYWHYVPMAFEFDRRWSAFYFQINLLRDCDRDGFGELMGRYSPGTRESGTLHIVLLSLTVRFLHSYTFRQDSHHPGFVAWQLGMCFIVWQC